MKLSRYTIFIDDFPDPGKTLAFHTRTQAQVVIDRQLRDLLARLPGPAPDEPARQAFSALERMGILAADAVDEWAALEEWFRALKTDTSCLTATVLTTYDCNFACTYCVEEGVKDAVRMDAATARRAVSYVAGRVAATNPKELVLKLYGGEPLLNLEALRLVARELGELARCRGISFSMGMTTNGALLTPRVVEELQGYGLKGVKITLDGTRPFHDRTRPFRSGKGSYDVIIKNLLAAVDRIEVEVGGNFDRENLESFPLLLDELKSLGLASRLKLVAFKPILATARDRDRAPPSADLGCAFLEPEVMRGLVDLRRLVLQKGFRATPGVGVQLCAMVMSPSNIVIDPRGVIYRCPAFVGRGEFAAGHIDRPGEEDFSTLDLWRRCRDCPWVPLCGDGCPYAAYVRFGDHTRLSCQRELMEYAVRENLKMNYAFSHRRATGS
jgi:uncharacterized protein